MESWLKEVKTQANPDIRIFLIGNKTDLEDQRKITSDKAQTFVDENNLHYFCETSAKTGFNAKNILVESAKLLYSEYLEYQKKHGKNAIYGNSAEANKRKKIQKILFYVIQVFLLKNRVRHLFLQ